MTTTHIPATWNDAKDADHEGDRCFILSFVSHKGEIYAVAHHSDGLLIADPLSEFTLDPFIPGSR